MTPYNLSKAKSLLSLLRDNSKALFLLFDQLITVDREYQVSVAIGVINFVPFTEYPRTSNFVSSVICRSPSLQEISSYFFMVPALIKLSSASVLAPSTWLFGLALFTESLSG